LSQSSVFYLLLPQGKGLNDQRVNQDVILIDG